MKIVMFTNTYSPHVGGVARSVDLFTRDLSKLGHEVLVVAPHFDGETEDDKQVLRVPAIKNFNGSHFSVPIPLPFMVEKTIQDFAPDVIHSHHPFLMGDTALRTARKHGLPLVFTHHTMYEQYTHYAPLDLETLRPFVIKLVTLYTDFCNHVIAPSSSIAEILRSRGVTRPIVDIPTGVDTAYLAEGDGKAFRQRHHIPGKAEVVGHLGRLAPEKNLRYLTQAVADYVRTKPQVYFLVVGDGPGSEEIVTFFEKADLASRLVMVGEKTGRELRDAYHAMDLFVFASRSETQGMVLVEAMAAGIPVIALDAPGSREVVKDGVNGRLLPADAHPGIFTRAVADYFGNDRKQTDWKEKAIGTAACYSREICARRMSELYTAVLENNRTQKHVVDDDRLPALEALVQRVNTEWELLVQKTQAAAEALHSLNKKSRAGVGPRDEQ